MKFKIFIILALLLFSIPAFSAGLKVDVNDDIYGAGDTFSVDVWINDLPTSEPGVGAFQFQLSFDNTAFYADSGVIYGADGAEEGIALTGRIPTHDYVEDDGDTLGNIDMPDNETGDYYFATATLPDMDMHPDENLPYGLYTGNVTADSVKLATFYFSFNNPQPLGTFDFNLIVDSTSAKATRICDIEGTEIEVDIEDAQVSIGGLTAVVPLIGFTTDGEELIDIFLRETMSGEDVYSFTNVTATSSSTELLRVKAGSYYVILGHFNQLDVITANPYNFVAGNTENIDFGASGVVYNNPALPNPALLNGEMRSGDGIENEIIDLDDFFAWSPAFGATPGSPNWDPAANYDLKESVDIIDLDDYFTWAGNFGETTHVPSGSRQMSNSKEELFASKVSDVSKVDVSKNVVRRGSKKVFGRGNRQLSGNIWLEPAEEVIMPGEDLEVMVKFSANEDFNMTGIQVGLFYEEPEYFNHVSEIQDSLGTDPWFINNSNLDQIGRILYAKGAFPAMGKNGINYVAPDPINVFSFTFHVDENAPVGMTVADLDVDLTYVKEGDPATNIPLDVMDATYTIPAPIIALSDTTISHTMQPNQTEDNAANFTISNTYNGVGTADLHFDITAEMVGGGRSSSSQSRKVDQIPVNARVISTSRNTTSASRTQIADSKSKAIAGNERGSSPESYRGESRRTRGKKASARGMREQVCEQWLCWDPDTGQIPKQNDQVVQLSFDTNGLGNGTYQLKLEIASNSGSPYTTPLDSIVEVMVTLNVEAPELVVNPEVLDEFSLYTDDVPPVDSMDLWIKNSHNATGSLEVSSIAPMTGDVFYTDFDAGSFGSLAIGDSSMIKVYFSTITAGTYNDTLEIVSNDPLSPHKVPLSGSLQCTPNFALSPDELNKTFEAYDDTDTETLTITNNQETGSGCDLIVTSLHVNADNPNPPIAFSGVTFPLTISPQASEDVTVEFYGEDVGTWDGAIYVEIGGGISTMDSVGLMVTVTEYNTVDIDPPVDDQEFLIYESSTVDLDNHIVTDPDHNADEVTWTAEIVTSTRGNKNSSSDFASRSARRLGSKGRDQSMKLRDQAKGRATQEFGDSELSVIIDDETHEITFANVDDWYGTKQVKIRAEGPKYGNNSDDYDEQTITVSVNAPDVNLPETSHSFTCFIDQDSTWMMTVENIADGTLDGNLMIEDVTISGSSEFTLGTYSGDPIAPGGSLDIPVIFNEGQDGPEGGPYTATLTIETNDPDEPSLDVTLTGNMECRPAISVSPTEVEANLEMMVIPSVVKYVDITNIADCDIDAPLEITDITLDVLTDTEVTVEYIAASRAELPYTLSNGETLQVKMTFHAAAVADIDDTLKIYSNDTDDPMVPVPVHYQVTPYEEIVLNLPDPFAFNEDETGTINLDDYVDMDPDHNPDEVMWTVSESVDDLFVEINDSREAIFTSSPHWYGFGNSVTFTGEGPGGEEVSQTIDVNVMPVNDAPSFTAGVDTTWLVGLVNDYSYTHTFMAKDIDGDALSFTYTGDGASITGFTATETSEVVGDTIHYTVELAVAPEASDVGVHTLTVTMSDVATRATVSEDITIDVRQSLMPDLVITETWDSFIIAYSGANSAVFNIEEIQSGVLRDITFEASGFTTYDGQTIDSFTFDPSSVDSLSALYESSGLHEMDITMNFTLPMDISDYTNFFDGTIKVMGYGMGADGDPNTYYEFMLEDVEIVVYPEDMEYEYEAFDFSGDNYVTSIDVLYFSHRYDTEPGDEYWDPICDIAMYEDIDGDGLDDLIFGQDDYVGFADLVYLSMYYGQGGGSVLAINPPSQSRSIEQMGILSAGFGNGQISELDNTLTLDILAESREIRAGEIVISYNPERAEFLTASEGNLMKNGGNGTFFNYKNNPENGILKISVSGLGSDYSVSNNGILATVQFKVNGNSDVAISHIKAIDSRVRAARTEKGESYEISSDETGVTATVPATYGLIQNYPNPFNPETTIEYQLPERANVTLGVYNSSGQLVKTLVDEEQDAGYRSVVWDGTDTHSQPVPSGLYIYIMDAGEFHQKRQMMLLK